VKEVDYRVIRAGEFLHKTVKYFREQVTKSAKPQKARKGQPAVPGIVAKHGQVFLQSEFPDWQQQILKFLQSCFDDSSKTFPNDLMKQLKGIIGSDPELKKNTKNVMQYAAFMKSEATAGGRGALDLKLPFDQKQVLEENKVYILTSLALESISFHNVGDNESESNGVPLNEAKMALAAPGKPSIYLYE